MLLWLLLILFAHTAFGGQCNTNDQSIYNRIGSTFPSLFRSYGGVWVSQARYEQRIVNEVGLSASCAQCYGNAYSCGWNNCKWDCSSAGSSCDNCLSNNNCIQNANRCTGFNVSTSNRP